MENQTLDHAFFERVEAEIAQALEQTAALEVDIEAFPAEKGEGWRAAFASMSTQFAGWHQRLGELTRQTATVEAELGEQETMMRHWFQSLGLASERLAEVAQIN